MSSAPLELHPLCALFPRMVGDAFETLKADIAANGLRQPIVMHHGMILDGGNRYRACMEAGIKPTLVEYTGTNLVEYVLSANLHRRHLSPGQHAAIVASAQDWARAQTVGKPKLANVGQLATVEQRAAQSGVSRNTQKMADKVARADPALSKAVAHGEVSLPKAVEQVTGKPRKTAPKPAAESAETENLRASLQEAREAISILSEENDTLNDRLVVSAMPEGTEQQTAAQTISDLRARIKVLEAELAAVKVSRDGYMRENAELKRQVLMQRKKMGMAA